jgi:hypothetical protein
MFSNQYLPLGGFTSLSRERYNDRVRVYEQRISHVLISLRQGSTEEQQLRAVRRIIDSISGLKLDLFDAALIYLRISHIMHQKVTCSLNLMFLNHRNMHVMHQIIGVRLRVLDILRERLNMLLSVETVRIFLNPPSELRFMHWGRYIANRAIALTMLDHSRLASNATSGSLHRNISSEIYEYIWDFARRKFNSKKYCRFVMAFPVGNSTGRLHRWTQRSGITFPTAIQDYVQELQQDPGAGTATPDDSSSESEPGSAEEMQHLMERVGALPPKRLFPVD